MKLFNHLAATVLVTANQTQEDNENNAKVTRFADRESDADFGDGGQYVHWNTFSKEFYEFIRPIWVAADGDDSTYACQNSPDLEIAAGHGNDILTIDISLIMGPGDVNAICGGDRADVIALKAIVNVMQHFLMSWVYPQ